MRRFWLALALKVIGPFAAIWTMFPLFTGASYWTGFVYTVWATAIGFVSDLYLVPRVGNLTGTALDVGLSAVLVPLLVRKPVPLSGWFWLLLTVAVVEYLFHYMILRRSRTVRRT